MLITVITAFNRICPNITEIKADNGIVPANATETNISESIGKLTAFDPSTRFQGAKCLMR